VRLRECVRGRVHLHVCVWKYAVFPHVGRLWMCVCICACEYVCVCVCGRARVQGRAVASEALPIVCGCVGVRVGVCHVCVHSGAG